MPQDFNSLILFGQRWTKS